MTTVDIATGRLLEQLQQAAAPDQGQAGHDAALIAKTRKATIDECQRWLLVSASIVERAGMAPPIRQYLMHAANHYRSAANLLETLR